MVQVGQMPAVLADKCSRCGIPRRAGAIFYLVRVSLTCDFDGELVEMDSEEIPVRIEEEIRKGLAKDEVELMEEVYQELYFYLCKHCRDQFVKRLSEG